MDYIKTVAKVLDKLNPDYYDVRYGESKYTTIGTEESKIREIASGSAKAVGIRVVHKGFQSFCSTDLLDRNSIIKTAKTAFKLSKVMQSHNHFKTEMGELPKKNYKIKVVGKKLPDSMSLEEKIERVLEYAKYGASLDKRVKNADIHCSDGIGTSLFLNSEGTETEKTFQGVKIGSTVTAMKGSRIESIGEGRGTVGGLEYIFNDKIYPLIEKNVKVSTDLLTAKQPKSGTYKIVIDQKLAGVLAHEAIGHPTEADAIVLKESVLCGKMNQKIASELISLSDDPTLKNFGYVGVDSEGVKPRKHKLIVNGILNEYLLDRDSASKLNMKTNGSARANSSRTLPQVRMSNTFFEAGDMTKEEVFEGIKEGYLLVDAIGGTTSPITGTFNFTSKCCYKIKNGEIGEIMLPIVFSGDVLTTLNDVTHIGNEVKFTAGYCGKGGQSLSVGTGGPYMRLKKANIGGRT